MNKWLSLSAIAMAALAFLAFQNRDFIGFKPVRAASFTPSDFVEIKTSNGVLYVASHETSVAQWRACVKDRACPDIPEEPTFDPQSSMTMINWRDITAYLKWYSGRTGQLVRLPNREEWRSLAGDHYPSPKQKLFDDPRLAWAATYDMTKSPEDSERKARGAFGINSHGIYDLKGNVWEWTSTCEQDFILTSTGEQICFYGRVAMGEHVAVLSDLVRDPGKAGCSAGLPPPFVGFRVVYDG